jgi:hypothetical protein
MHVRGLLISISAEGSPEAILERTIEALEPQQLQN